MGGLLLPQVGGLLLPQVAEPLSAPVPPQVVRIRVQRTENIPVARRGIIWRILIRGRHIIVSDIIQHHVRGTRVVHVRIMILTIIGPNYYCAGGTARPVFNKVTITYDLNGGDGSVPSPELCTPNSTCPLVKGNTTSFWRAGYVFKGWTPEGSTSDKVVDFDDFVPGSENMTLYAVWTPCGIGMYKPGSGTQAAAACSSCPELTPGFEYFPATTNASLTECRQGITNAEDANEYCDAPSVTTELFDIQCYAMSDGTWGDCAIGNAWTAKPGSYVGIWKQTMPAEDVIENMCIPCGVGTYSVVLAHTVKAD